MFTPFQNEYPFPNFNDERPRRKMEEALALVGNQLNRIYPAIIGGEKVETLQRSMSRNPARPAQVIGQVCDSSPEVVERAILVARETFETWSRVPIEVRARYLVMAAAILRRRIYEFSAWMVLEASKSWGEAYGDTAEAIDFLEFYAREALKWGQPHPTTFFSGEENEVRYQPIGVGVVITPWNFPLAILTGMTAAAIVTGNTVVLKPAEQTPIIAAKFMELMELAGLPPGVINLVPGPGETVGEALTGDPDIHFVSFTGSREVGLHIHQRIAAQHGRRWLKKGILELGGKDAIIVDEGVNLDGVAGEVVASAFGFQGQKCSACSRLIAHEKVYDQLLAKVVERAGKLVVGDPAQPATYMGAVIDRAAYDKILAYIQVGRSEGRLVMGGVDPQELEEGVGYFVHPTVIADVHPKARIAQEEIFGPVLSVMRAESFDQALEMANDTDYGLTGAVFSYNRDHLERARHEFHVGNLYLNRKCTGALVDVQPFGGFKMSGTDSKAGGRDYLGHFLQAKSISERW